MYGIYIIHDKKKVGLAKDIDDRLAQQGYSRKDRGVVIFQEGIKDLADARMMEKTAQEALGYTDFEDQPDLVDRALGKTWRERTQGSELWIKSHKGNTFGFQIPTKDFDAYIDKFDLIELEDSKYGKLNFSCQECKDWLKANKRASKFVGGKLPTYIYVKAAYEFLNKKTEPKNLCNEGTLDNLISSIHDWADNRGILDGNITTQTLKLGEEFGELQKAVLKDQPLEIKDAIGDIIVVLVSIAHFNNHSVADAVQMAYDTIIKRTGYTNDKGDFIKTHFDGKEINDTL